MSSPRPMYDQTLTRDPLPIWAKVVTQLPLPLWFFIIHLHRRWLDYHSSRILEVSEASGLSRVWTYIWSERSSLMKDMLIIGVPVINVVLTDIYGSTSRISSLRALLFWTMTVVFDHLRERDRFMKNFGWNMLDVFIIVFFGWSLTAITQLFAFDGRTEWSMDPSITLFFVNSSRLIMFPISMLIFLMFFRVLRYLHIFPSIVVPWQTFTRSGFLSLTFMLIGTASTFCDAPLTSGLSTHVHQVILRDLFLPCGVHHHYHNIRLVVYHKLWRRDTSLQWYLGYLRHSAP